MKKEENLVKIFLSYMRVGRDLKGGLNKTIFDAISRTEEFENDTRDKWGNWDYSYNKSYFSGQLLIPWVDKNLQDEFSFSKSLWPNNKKFALCITHDVDIVAFNEWDNILRFLKRRLQIDEDVTVREKMLALLSFINVSLSLVLGKKKRFNHNYDYKKWLDIEDKFGFRSTFFVFPTDVSRFSKVDCFYRYKDKTVFGGSCMSVEDMIREIDRLGWEIGLHGSVIAARDFDVLRNEKTGLESVVGHEIVSIRNHFLAYDIKITPRIQSDAGFLIDSTQGFNRAVGFRAGTSFPYPCYDHLEGKVLPVWEIPQHIMDGALFTANALEYNEVMAKKMAAYIIDQVESVGGVLCINWHPNNLDNEVCLRVFEYILEEGYKRDAWGCSLKDLYQHWMSRG